MCGSSKGSTTTSTTPNPQAMAAYGNLMGRIGKVSNTPYDPYSGELVAGVNPEQYAGIGNINQYANYALPYNQQAIGMATAAAQPISADQIQRYMDPFTQQVIDATQNQFNNANNQQMQGVRGNAIAQGALGGSREAVAESELANQQQLAQAPVLAGLRSQGYQTGLNTALTEQQAEAQGAYGIGNLGMSGEQAALQGAGAQIGAGGLQQQTQQALDQALLQQFMQKQAYPYQQLSWAAGLDSGLGSQMGGTSTTTPPPPNLWSSIIGAGATLGAAAMKAAPAAARGGVVPHYDDGGGVPPDGSMGVAGMPWGGARGWIPSAGITHGKGPPAPPSPGQPQDIAGQAKQIGALADMLRGKPYPQAPGAPMNILPTQGVAPADNFMGPPMPPPENLSGLYHRGGHVRQGWMPHGIAVPHYDDGGGVDTFADRFNAASDFDTPIEPPRGVVFHNDDFNFGGDEAKRAALLSAYREENKGNPAIYGGAPYEPDASPVPLPRSRPAGVVPREDYRDMHGGRSYAGRGAPADAMAFTGDSVDGGGNRGDGLAAIDSALAYSPRRAPSRAAVGVVPEEGGIDWSSKSKLWPALMAAGLGMMASRSPYAGVGIGEGGLMGMQAYTHAAEAEQGEKFNQRKLDMEAAKLHEQVEREARRDTYEQARLNQPKLTTDERGVPILVNPLTGHATYVGGQGTPMSQQKPPEAGGIQQLQPWTPPPAPKLPDNLTPEAKAAAIPVHSVLVQDTSGPLSAPREGTHPEALDGMSPDEANTVRAIAEGRRQFLPQTRGNKYNEYLMRKVYEYDPGADQTLFGRRQRTANFFAVGTQGGGGQNIAAINTWAQHAGQLAGLADELKNSRQPWWNAVQNLAADKGLSDDKRQDLLGRMDVLLKAVGDEGAKVFAGSNSALADRKEWESRLGRDTPAPVMAEKLKTVAEAVEARLNSMTNQYNEGMRTNHDPADFLAPETRKLMRVLKGEGAPTRASSAPPASAPQGQTVVQAPPSRPSGIPADAISQRNKATGAWRWRAQDGSRTWGADGTPQ